MRRLLRMFVLCATLPFSTSPVVAHSASDAYLTLQADANLTMHGQWDIALRDLDFVLHLDAGGDGRLTWGDVRRNQGAITRYAYAHLRVAQVQGGECAVVPHGLLIDGHADGAYAALFFDVHCPAGAREIALAYDLFFKLDPSHRAILVMRGLKGVATAVLSPQNSRVNWPQ
jgi:hypothetical protein